MISTSFWCGCFAGSMFTILMLCLGVVAWQTMKRELRKMIDK